MRWVREVEYTHSSGKIETGLNDNHNSFVIGVQFTGVAKIGDVYHTYQKGLLHGPTYEYSYGSGEYQSYWNGKKVSDEEFDLLEKESLEKAIREIL